ncbi:hypothetical protein ACRRTK_020417 [Alexandromys fortis]
MLGEVPSSVLKVLSRDDPTMTPALCHPPLLEWMWFVGLASPSPFQQKVKFQAGTSLSSTRSTPVTSPWAGLWKAI